MALLKPKVWNDRIDRTTKLLKEKRKEALRFKRAYTGDFRGKDGKLQKNITNVNFEYWLVETILPTIFSGQPKIAVLPRENPALYESANLLKLNTNYWLKETGSRAEYKDCLLDNFFGPSSMFNGWEYVTEIQKRKHESGQIIKEEVVIRDQPIVQWLDFWDEVRIDPDCKRTRFARWMARRITMTHEDFLNLGGVDKKYQTGEKAIKPTMRPEDLEEKSFRASFRDGEGGNSDADWISFWEVWDRGGMNKLWVHENCDGYLNEDLDWPYDFEYENDPFPITILHAKPDPESGISFSEFRPIQDQIEERTRTRSIMTAIVKRLAPKYLHDAKTGSNAQINKFLNSDPLSANLLDRPEGLRIAPMPEIPPDFWNWDSVLRDDLGNISGLTEFQGQQTSNTATEASIAEGRSNVRKSARNTEFELFVAKTAGKLAMLTQQLQDRRKTILIHGPNKTPEEAQVFEITKDKIQGEYDFDIIAGSMEHVNEGMIRKELMRFAEIAGNSPEVSQEGLWRKIAEAHDLDPKDVLVSQEERQSRTQAPPPTFKPIGIEDVNPADQVRVVEAAKAAAGIKNLSPEPAQQAQQQLASLDQGQAPGIMQDNAPVQPPGAGVPEAPVNDASLTSER